MELTPEKLAVLKRLTELMHRRNTAELAHHVQERQRLRARVEEAKSRAGVVMPPDTSDPATALVAARQWAASSGPVARQLLDKKPALDASVSEARDRTRASLARSEACDAIGDALDAEARKAEMRREDRAYRPSHAGNLLPRQR